MLWVALDQAHTNDGQNHSEQFVGDILFERTPRCKAKAQHVFRNEALLKGVIKQTVIKIIVAMSNKGFCNKVGYQILITINPATI